MSVEYQKRARAWGVLLASALALGGCSSSVLDWPGTPTDASARSRDGDTYLPVHDLPPDRREAVIPPAERTKIEAELAAARDRQAAPAAKEPGAKDPAAK